MSALQKKVVEIFQKFIRQYGWKGFFELLFYPAIVLLTTPVRLIQTLINCRILASGKGWDKYPNFQVHKSLNYVFYWTRALAINRHGRSGVCPNMALGNYSLSRCFHYSLLSLFAYWQTGVVSIMFGMFGWWIAHFFWVPLSGATWVSAVMALALISTTFYGNIFGHQNYNALGWLFFPLVIFGLINHLWILLALASLFVSFGSFTVFFISCLLSVVYAISIGSINPILATLPVILKMSTHFFPLFKSGKAKEIMSNVAKAIGLTKRKAKYKRPIRFWSFDLLYFMVIYGQFFFVDYFLTHRVSIVLLISIILVLINSTYFRFADRQSMQMLILSITTAETLNSQSCYLLPSYWIAISPLPLFIGFPSMNKVLSIVPKLAPYSIENLARKIEKFLGPVKPGERILMTFKDPKGSYHKIFDGYRILLELPFYVSTIKGIHLMPDWWAVFDLNYEGAPDFWGTDVTRVSKNASDWNAHFVVIYQEAGTTLHTQWEKAGFRVLTRFSWAEQERELQGIKPYTGKTPEWWLLKVPEELKE